MKSPPKPFVALRRNRNLMQATRSSVSTWQRLAFCCLVALAAACAFETADRPSGPQEATQDQDVISSSNSLQASGSDPEACEDGTVTACSVELPSHNGVRTCFEGLRLCVEGHFGDCHSPSEIESMLGTE